MTQDENPPTSSKAVRRPATKMAFAWTFLPLFFLVTGGSIDWWEAWAYCGVLLGPMTVFLIHMIRHDPEFLARRVQLHEKEKAQRRILAFGYPFILAGFILPGLDHRFGWSRLPLWVVIVALAIVLGAYLGVIRVFLVNRWAGRTVETWAEQRVVSTGPYAIVRHPMYSATLALYLATPLALGSMWAVLPFLAFIPVFVFRIRNEEEVLVRDLQGYAEYRERIRHRLIPFIW